ncbi:Phosphatidylinositol-4-phosphate 5-kinase [Gamsiella multidivaricata]|nr:Phosphatidylinositol-4-phosphate 5-kinase [Gamsiella multidivaricata]
MNTTTSPSSPTPNMATPANTNGASLTKGTMGAQGFYSDLLLDDTNDTGVFSSTTFVAQSIKQGVQRVSEGTQTTPSLEGPPPVQQPLQLQPPQQQPQQHHLTNTQSIPTWPSGTVARFHVLSPEQKQLLQVQPGLSSSSSHSNPPSIPISHSVGAAGASPALGSNNTAATASSIHTPMTPPRISSLAPKSNGSHFPYHQQQQQQQQQYQHHQQHSPPPSPPTVSAIAPHQQQQQSVHLNGGNTYSNLNGTANGYHLQSQQQQPAFTLEPSPTLSTTETFPASSAKSASLSSPASSISSPVGAASQPTPVDLALAALSSSTPRPSTSTMSSSASTPTNRPRPSSYAPIKLTNVSSTVANMTTLATLPIPPASATSPTSASIITATSASYEDRIEPLQQQPTVSTSSDSDLQRSPASSLRPNMSIFSTGSSLGAAGAGGGYQSPKAGSPGPFGPPTRASTMDYRKIQPGSTLLGDSPAFPSTARQEQQQQQQTDPQAEHSSKARRRQIYRRNTYSADLASTSFHRSDDEMEMDELEEARRRMDVLKKSSSRRFSKRRKDDDTDRVLIGTRIGEGHVNYVLMYNMLTGIRVSVSRCQAKPQRPLVDEDFTSAHKLAFDITGNELTPSSKYDFKFKDYAPWVFRNLREDFHIDASDYLVSLTSKYILSELGSPGKSGSFFYFSQDYRFIIKTIHHSEHKFMRKILKDYFNHVKQNPHTLLCRFFGLHRVKLPHGRKIHFVVMGNVFPPNRDIHETYDLKGSTLGRAISDEELNNNPRATQKDLNWVNRNRKLELGPVKRHLFVEQMKRDVELLARLNIMDYSLLIGIHDIERGNKDNIRDNTLKVFHPDTKKQLAREPSRRDKRESKVNALRMAVKESDPVAIGPSALPSDSFSERRHCIFYADDGGLLSTNEQNEQGQDLYYLGVIDILTPYNYVKKIEHYWKSLSQDKHQISAVNPKEYAQRFLSFMIHAIKVNNDVMEVLEEKSHPHSE